MQGLILAAGMGKRLGELTSENTKCMVEVNGVTLIDRMLHQLERLHLSRIVIVIGYEGKKLMDYIGTLDIQTPICFVNNPVYDKTNNIYSLSLAKEYLVKEDTLLLESDLIFEDSVLDILLEDSRESLVLVDKYLSWMDGTCVKIGPEDTIESFIPKHNIDFRDMSQLYKTVNIYKFSKNFSETHYVPFLEAYTKALGNNEYYEQVLRVIAVLDNPEIKVKKLSGQSWYEIDDIQDLDIAQSLFAPDDGMKLASMHARYGGYWRYPGLLDFFYLVTPYYPPKQMVDEIKANFELLLTQYPSGMNVNSLVAARNFGIKKEHIVVGNGAAELIKCFMEMVTGKVGFIRPTFDEYPNRYSEKDSVFYVPEREGFAYTAEDLTTFFEDKGISTLILVNPDNPTGNYIDKEGVGILIKWCKEQDITLVVDESFLDFAEDERATLFTEEKLAQYKKLIVVKSISKSYGVPGLRLGVLASSDNVLIAELKRRVSIWNINSFGEFFMQIAGKYSQDYQVAIQKFKKARKIYIEELSKIPALHVFPSQANYVMAEITNGVTSGELTKLLLTKHKILIKDLSMKIRMEGRQFIRLAVRNERENEQIVTALREELG